MEKELLKKPNFKDVYLPPDSAAYVWDYIDENGTIGHFYLTADNLKDCCTKYDIEKVFNKEWDNYVQPKA